MAPFILLGLSAGLLARAQPVDNCGLKTRNEDDTVNLCEGVVNCEQYFDEFLGGPSIWIKEGMGPGSDWYNEFVAPFDPWISNDADDAAADDDDPAFNVSSALLSPRAVQHHSNVDRSAAKIQWGNAKPFDAVNNGIKYNCPAGPCFASWTHGIEYVASKTRHSGTLHFTADGNYPNSKGYYARALAEIARKLHRNQNKTWTQCEATVPNKPPVCSSHKMRNNQSGKYFAITRYHNGAISGQMKLKVSFQANGNDPCGYIVEGSSSLMASQGPIGAIGGGYFGDLKKPICG